MNKSYSLKYLNSKFGCPSDEDRKEVVKTETFKVYGNCGMCENRIEKAAGSINGVSTADWNRKTKIIAIKYDSSKTSLAKIHQTIAKAGHDTDKEKAKDADYEKLHACCRYQRVDIN